MGGLVRDGNSSQPGPPCLCSENTEVKPQTFGRTSLKRASQRGSFFTLQCIYKCLFCRKIFEKSLECKVKIVCHDLVNLQVSVFFFFYFAVYGV